ALLVHDLTLNDTRGILSEAIRGVYWSNTVTGVNTLGQNLEFLQCKAIGFTNSWTTPSTMGTNDTSGESNIYVEDNCRMVIRHNTFDNSALGSHGADTSAIGNRHFELYENTFIFSNFNDC